MAKPEALFCKILEDKYNTITQQVDDLLVEPLVILKSIKSAIKRTELVVLNEAQKELEAIVVLAIEVLDLANIRYLDEKREDFCQVAFSCSALMTRLFEPQTGEVDYLSFISSADKTTIKNNYTEFKKQVCKLSLIKIVNKFIDGTIDILRARINALRIKIDNALNLSWLIYQYDRVLNSLSIKSLLLDLDYFASCGFSTCNFIFTVSNKTEDYADKLYLTKSSGTYKVDLSSLLTTIYSVEEDISDKLTEIETWLDNRDATVNMINVDELFRG